ncbi:hypothetical protein BC833DRAFT_597044, partial [Globomyces pollinis-pini]
WKITETYKVFNKLTFFKQKTNSDLMTSNKHDSQMTFVDSSVLSPELASRLPRVNADIQLYPLADLENPIMLKDLFSKSPCILFVLRSPFCMTCRRMTSLMIQYVTQFKEYNVNTYCILKEPISDDKLQYIHFPKEFVFVDPKYDLCKVLGDEYGEFRKTTFSHSTDTIKT